VTLVARARRPARQGESGAAIAVGFNLRRRPQFVDPRPRRIHFLLATCEFKTTNRREFP
jgi:hypothetical protein